MVSAIIKNIGDTKEPTVLLCPREKIIIEKIRQSSQEAALYQGIRET